MVAFGYRQLQQAAQLSHPQLRAEEANLNYRLLKQRLNQADAAAGAREVQRYLLYSFQHLLDSELEKVLALYTAHAGKLLADVAALQALVEEDTLQRRLRYFQADMIALSWSEKNALWTLLGERARECRRLAEHWHGILDWITLQFVALRKIMKKYAKKGLTPIAAAEAFTSLTLTHPSLTGGTLLQGSFLDTWSISSLQNMFSHQDLVVAGSSLQDLLGLLHATKMKLSFSSDAGDGGPPPDGLADSYRRAREALAQAGPDGSGSTRRSLDGAQEALSRSSSLGRASARGLGEEGKAFRALVAKMRRAEAACRESASGISLSKHLEAQAGIFTAAPAIYRALASRSGLVINLLSAMLYMANYNLVLPQVVEFVEFLGFSEAASGLVVGAADLSAIGVSLLYAWWTSRSYTRPLVFSGLACLAGNAVYSLAYTLRSLPLLLASRLLIGLGSARAVNRRYVAAWLGVGAREARRLTTGVVRYIADYVGASSRTAASAAFVGASAGGAALGPLFAVALAEAKPYASRVLGVLLTDETIAGYVMVVVWLGFLVVVVLGFHDPLRESVDESDRETEDEGGESGAEEEGEASDGEAAAEPPEAAGGGPSEPLLPAAAPGPARRLRGSRAQQVIALVLLELFVLKLLQQGMLSTVGIIAPAYYRFLPVWFVGVFLALLSLAMVGRPRAVAVVPTPSFRA